MHKLTITLHRASKGYTVPCEFTDGRYTIRITDRTIVIVELTYLIFQINHNHLNELVVSAVLDKMLHNLDIDKKRIQRIF